MKKSILILFTMWLCSILNTQAIQKPVTGVAADSLANKRVLIHEGIKHSFTGIAFGKGTILAKERKLSASGDSIVPLQTLRDTNYSGTYLPDSLSKNFRYSRFHSKDTATGKFIIGKRKL